ncbi:MAG: hypothetical protein EOO62_05295, partial [Hymenobacter sp.]
MKKPVSLGLALLLGSQAVAQTTGPQADKTSFQIDQPWSPAVDVRADIVMLYGIGDDFPARAASWKGKGYDVQFMTGIAWGNYQPYFDGRFDGKTHAGDVQQERDGTLILHGPTVPYIVPSQGYLAYMKTQVKQAIDLGVTAIYLEEPEFWARGGYSETFKQEWQAFYHAPWQPQHASPEATYLSSKLKYQLYFNALKELFSYAKSYSESKGRRVKCFVPTHSLLNYSAWEIVSPEASLAALPGMDGYIAQVWTGTARVPNYYRGVKKERVFENAFLEYSSVLSMTAPTQKTVYFLTDPIEDGVRSWDDYKRNYEATFTAELMFPSVGHFEVMPWPNRIYQGKFPVEGQAEPQPIAPAYATQMQVMINALNTMPQAATHVSGSQGVAVLLGNSMMFQRFPTHKSYEDPLLSNFYGLALPLFKRGVPVGLVHMENLGYPDALRDTKVLLMSYANMKPTSAQVHEKLAEWVKAGGVLVYYGKDADPFQQVQEWWNTGPNHYATPLAHLLEIMQLPLSSADAAHTYGKGKVYVTRTDPKELAMQAQADQPFIKQLQTAYERDAHAGPLTFKNSYRLDRGPYTLAAVLDENDDQKPLVIQGPLLDLYDPELPVLPAKSVAPGQQAFLYRLAPTKGAKTPQVLATAARVYDFNAQKTSVSFSVKSPANTNNVMRILLPSKPTTETCWNS